jgi:protoheme IX farnesyltransferase
MFGPSIVTEQLASSSSQRESFLRSTLSDYWALTKPEVNFLILITTGVGFYLGCRNEARPLSVLALFNTLLGTLLVASGTGTLNQYIEREFDAQMRRTARRPAAAGRLEPAAVLAFGIALAAAGTVYLAGAVNLLTSSLAALTLLIYLFLYTPLKRKTALCVPVGAFPGAMPPLIGWAAASGHLPLQAWTLYALLFLWQFPHFMAIAWMYREDYDRAGYLVLPHHGGARARFVNCQTMLPLLILAFLSLLSGLEGARTLYWLAALALNLGFLYYGMRFVLNKSGPTARRLLAASIIYLPLLFALIAAPQRLTHPRDNGQESRH